jgi:phosphate transport system substrate-binding protein
MGAQGKAAKDNLVKGVPVSNRLRAAMAAASMAIIGAVPTVAALSAAAPNAAQASGAQASRKVPTITMSGSTSVAPLAALLARKYVKVCGHCVSFRLLQGGSDVGVSDVAHGRVSIGNSSRDPKPSDPGGLVFNPIAHDAICIITNKSNPVPNIDQAGVQAVFGGATRSWSGVPGARANGTIDVIVRTAASGTQDAFQKIFMGSKSVFSGASQKASNGLVQSAVAGDPNGVGYVSLAFTQGVNTIPYKGVPCTLRDAKSGAYGGIRTFYMVTLGPPKGAVRKWLKWINHNKKAQKIIATDWVPLH